jgi:hypothetical protein
MSLALNVPSLRSVQDNRAVMKAGISLQVLAGALFAPHGGAWRNVAIYEVVMGVMTGIGLWLD